ncbi:MAG: DUF1731 domain-containing protein [Pedobacter sp.]|nr:DUF1731 domain-containing protein [Chitinophagaceae bacterium]
MKNKKIVIAGSTGFFNVAIIGTETKVILKNRRVLSTKLHDAGFTFT